MNSAKFVNELKPNIGHGELHTGHETFARGIVDNSSSG